MHDFIIDSFESRPQTVNICTDLETPFFISSCFLCCHRHIFTNPISHIRPQRYHFLWRTFLHGMLHSFQQIHARTIIFIFFPAAIFLFSGRSFFIPSVSFCIILSPVSFLLPDLSAVSLSTYLQLYIHPELFTANTVCHKLSRKMRRLPKCHTGRRPWQACGRYGSLFPRSAHDSIIHPGRRNVNKCVK